MSVVYIISVGVVCCKGISTYSALVKQVDVVPSKNQALCKLNHCQSTAIQCIDLMTSHVSQVNKDSSLRNT